VFRRLTRTDLLKTRKSSGFLAGVLAMGLACVGGLHAEEEVPSPSDARVPVLSPLATTGPTPHPVEAPTAEKLEQSIDLGIDFLLKTQNKNGSWGTFRTGRPNDVLAPMPGSHHAFQAATTSICVTGLIESGWEREDVREAVAKAETFLIKELPRVRRPEPAVFYNTWAHAFSIQAMSKLLAVRQGDDDACRRLREAIAQQIAMLAKYEVVDGGWAYYDFAIGTKKPAGSSISFVTGTVLIAFAAAREQGIEIPEKLVKRGMASIRRQRKPDYTYAYGEYLKYQPMRGINRHGGSLGRMQVCNLAMRRWGDETVTDKVITTALGRLFARNMWLDIGRKRPIPHEAWMGVAGYFFYYGHYYGALNFDELPLDELAPLQEQMGRIMVDRQEKDGSWWDFPLYGYHKQYGTGFALSTLARCRK